MGSELPPSIHRKAMSTPRLSQNDRLEAYFRARPGQRLAMPVLAEVANCYAVHSRIDDLRHDRGMNIPPAEIEHAEVDGRKVRKSFYTFWPEAPQTPQDEPATPDHPNTAPASSSFATVACRAVQSMLLSALICVAPQLYGQPLPPKVKTAIAGTNTWFFAATAYSADGLESDYSSEVSVSNAPRNVNYTLAWDASIPSTNVAGYRIYQGAASRTYTNRIDVGTNLTASVQIGKAMPTNRIVTVLAMTATNSGGPWSVFTNWPAVIVTNAPVNRYFKLSITETNL